MLKIVLSLILLFATYLNAYCFIGIEPRKPYCVDIKYAYDNKYSFDDCRREVVKYLKDLDEYVMCVEKEAKEKTIKIIEKFNCYASGETICF